MIVSSSRLGVKIEITLQTEEEVEAFRNLIGRTVTVPYLLSEGKVLDNIDLCKAAEYVGRDPKASALRGLFRKLNSLDLKV